MAAVSVSSLSSMGGVFGRRAALRAGGLRATGRAEGFRSAFRMVRPALQSGALKGVMLGMAGGASASIINDTMNGNLSAGSAGRAMRAGAKWGLMGGIGGLGYGAGKYLMGAPSKHWVNPKFAQSAASVSAARRSSGVITPAMSKRLTKAAKAKFSKAERNAAWSELGMSMRGTSMADQAVDIIDRLSSIKGKVATPTTLGIQMGRGPTINTLSGRAVRAMRKGGARPMGPPPMAALPLPRAVPTHGIDRAMRLNATLTANRNAYNASIAAAGRQEVRLGGRLRRSRLSSAVDLAMRG